jgi:hypothetical protein
MGDIATKSARITVGRCLEESDARVRANAVEAMLRSREPGEFVGAVAELKCDPHHRVRANALRGVIEMGGGGKAAEHDGVDGLASMLLDDRQSYRLAGLWLAERALTGRARGGVGAAWDPLCRRVAAMASRDEDAGVRARATFCARRLLGEMRANPSKPIAAKGRA